MSKTPHKRINRKVDPSPRLDSLDVDTRSSSGSEHSDPPFNKEMKYHDMSSFGPSEESTFDPIPSSRQPKLRPGGRISSRYIDSSRECDSGGSFPGLISGMCNDCPDGKCCSDSCGTAKTYERKHKDHTTTITVSEVCRPLDPGKLNCNVNGFYGMVLPAVSMNQECLIAEFSMRRKNKTITLQWEEISGLISGSGVNYIEINQPIPNLPNKTKTMPLVVSHRGKKKNGYIEICPDTMFNIRFYLDLDHQPLQLNDSFTIYSSAVTWIID